MHLTIAYSKINKRNLVLINNDTYQRETLSEGPIRQPLKSLHTLFNKYLNHMLVQFEQNRKIQTIQNFELLTKKKIVNHF